MKKQITMGLTALALVAGFSTAASANSITAWSCEETSSGQTLTLTTQSAVSTSAVINLDGTAQSGSVTVSGTNASIAIGANVACWDVTFTITDGGSTFGLN